MFGRKINTRYISEDDQFLIDFNQSHPTQSLAQQKERAKHKRIFELRDKPRLAGDQDSLWQDF